MAYKNSNGKTKVILDFDDVLAELNALAVMLLNKTTGSEFTVEDITSWGEIGTDIDKRIRFFNDPVIYRNQTAMPDAVEFLEKLMKVAEVTIMTAVYPQFMSLRAVRIHELFPNFPLNRVIMGEQKELVHADIILDDRIRNIMSTNCRLPVLFRQPWNRQISGICSVNNYDDFLEIVNIMNGQRKVKKGLPKIVCIAGAGGSGKHMVRDALCSKPGFEPVYPYTTAKIKSGIGIPCSPSVFKEMADAGEFVEDTYYDHERYGSRLSEYEEILNRGSSPVSIMDMSGCVSVARKYPDQSIIVFVERKKRDCILSILNKNELSKIQIADRITAIDFEQRNSVLADYTVSLDGSSVEDVVQEIMELI